MALARQRYPAKPVPCTCRQVSLEERASDEGKVMPAVTLESGTTIGPVGPVAYCDCKWAEFCYAECECGCCRYYFAEDFDILGREIASLTELELGEPPVVAFSRETIGPLVGGWKKQIARMKETLGKDSFSADVWISELTKLCEEMEEFEKTEEVLNVKLGQSIAGRHPIAEHAHD